MNAVLEVAASNVVLSALLAIVTVAVTRVWRSPQLAHGLWLLVLLKLVTPPLISVSAPSAWLTEQPVAVQASLPATYGEENTASLAGDKGIHFPEPDPAMEAPAVAFNGELPQRPAGTTLNEIPAPITHGEPIDTPARVASAVKPTTIPWPAAIACVWLAGAIIYVAILVLRCIRFRRVLYASTDAGASISESVGRLAAALGIRRCPPVRIVDAAVPPLVWSLGLRPVIVLPSKLLAELSPAQCDALVAHELAHIRRRDDLVRWLEVIALVAFWWNPVAWFARRRLREAEEECCDAWVVWALPDERRSYGEAMLATIEFLTDGPPLPALAGSTFGGSFYKRRIEMIMKRNVSRRISRAALGMIVFLAVSVLPIVAQTTGPDAAESLAQPGSTATEKSDAVADDRTAADDGVAADDAQIGAAADAHAVESSAAPTVGGSSSDAVGLTGDVQNPRAPVTDVTTGASVDQAKSIEDIQELVSRVEQLLQENSDLRRAADIGTRTGASPRLSSATISSDKQEQDLQLELLMLDVVAAKADIEPAKLKWQKSVEANKKQPGTVSHVEVELQRAEFEQKLVQRQRAEALFALYKRQVERNREEAAQQQRQQAPAAVATNRALDELNKALRAEELVRLKKLNEETVKEITRLERLLKEEPDSPKTRQAVEDFWRAYRSLQGREANEDFWKVHRSLRGEANEGYWKVYPSLQGGEANQGDAGGGSATNGKN